MASMLDPVVASRYSEKIALIEGRDPYEIDEWEWNDIETTEVNDSLPNITFPDVFAYLVCHTSFYTKEELKAYKGLGAFNQAYNGFVTDVKAFQPVNDKYVLLTAKVLHSMKMNEKALQPWVIAGKDGTVESAHCTCMAGLAETCTHVAALLFFVETKVRLGERTTVTGRPAYWKPPCSATSAAKMAKQHEKVSCINFTTAKTQRKIIMGESSTVKTPNSKQPIKKTNMADKEAFCRALHDVGSESAFLRIWPDYAPTLMPSPNFPKPLSCLNQDMSFSCFENLIDFCKSVEVQVTEEQARTVERETRGQAASKLWHRQREGRVTASKLHSVCHTNVDNPSLSLIKSIVRPQSFTTTATAWGSDHEEIAKKGYQTEMVKYHDKFVCSPSGLFISSVYPFLAGTPDGLVSCACCFGSGCLEIKCPYTARDLTIQEAVATLKDFCLVLINGEISLSKQHQYYYQVQCQLLVSKSSYVDFCVWTQKDIFVQRLYGDNDFILECVEKASLFFRKAVLPEIVANHFSLQKSKPLSPSKIGSNTVLYCLCRQPEYGRMIQCEGLNCVVGWYHFDCVNLSRAPRGKWLCTTCRSTDKTKGKRNVKKQSAGSEN